MSSQPPAWAPNQWGQAPPPGWQPAPKTDGKAVAALVLALLSFVLCPLVAAVVALILAGAAARSIRASGGAITGSGLVTGARVLGWLNVAASIGLIVFLVLVAPDLDDWFNDVIDRRPIDDLAVGECFEDATFGGDTVTDVRVIPCDESHDYEATLVSSFPEPVGAVWPGELSLRESAAFDCNGAFLDYMGVSPESSIFDNVVFVPDIDGWETGDRWFVCAVQTDGSAGRVRGTGR